jgi:hypothetical protein
VEREKKKGLQYKSKFILKSENCKSSKINYQGFKYTTMLIDKWKKVGALNANPLVANPIPG